MLDAPRNLSTIHGGSQGVEEPLEATRRYQRAVWFVLALIASAEITFGLWLVGLLGSR
jgi:hypothetical protein